MKRWWIGVCLVLVWCTASLSDADDRRGPPFGNEHSEGCRTWRPDRDRRGYGQPLPDRFTIDKPGKCEVICERRGREYTPKRRQPSTSSQPRGGETPRGSVGEWPLSIGADRFEPSNQRPEEAGSSCKTRVSALPAFAAWRRALRST